VGPDPVGSASFFRIRIPIRIQGLPIRLRLRNRIYVNQPKSKIYFFPENFNIHKVKNKKILKILTPMTLTKKIKQFFHYVYYYEQDPDPDRHQK
jgi:hypothetical protein